MSEHVLFPFQEINNQSTLEVRPERVRPIPNISDSPVRCYKINLEWCKFMAGAMSEMMNLQAWADVTDEQSEIIQQVIQMLEGDDCVNCEDVENCLETSTIITNINTNITTVQQAQEECCEQAGQVINIYPPPPDAGQAIDLCSSAVYVAQQLSALWHDVVTDAQTITFDEFVEALIAVGGFDLQFVELLWDFVVSNANPNLVAEGEAAFDEIVKILFCNEFDRDLVDLEIDGSTTMTSDAKGLWRGALSAVTDGKIATWVFLGSLKGLSSTECVCNEICGFHDFALSDGGFTPMAIPLNGAGWDTGIGWVGHDTGNPVGQNWRSCYIERAFTDRPLVSVEVHYNYEKGSGLGASDTVVQFAVRHNGNVVVAHSETTSNAVEGDDLSVLLQVDADADEIELLATSAKWTGSTPPPDVGKVEFTGLVVVCQ